MSLWACSVELNCTVCRFVWCVSGGGKDAVDVFPSHKSYLNKFLLKSGKGLTLLFQFRSCWLMLAMKTHFFLLAVVVCRHAHWQWSSRPPDTLLMPFFCFCFCIHLMLLAWPAFFYFFFHVTCTLLTKRSMLPNHYTDVYSVWFYLFFVLPADCTLVDDCLVWLYVLWLPLWRRRKKQRAPLLIWARLVRRLSILFAFVVFTFTTQSCCPVCRRGSGWESDQAALAGPWAFHGEAWTTQAILISTWAHWALQRWHTASQSSHTWRKVPFGDDEA